MHGRIDYVANDDMFFSLDMQIGFVCLLVLEAIFNKGLLEMIGVTVGKGLDIGF